MQYFSRATTKEDQKYHSYELETLGVVNVLQKFKIYLIGNRFKFITDCNALRTTLTKRHLIPRIARWWLTTQEFDFTIQYSPRCRISHGDALSRNPAENSDMISKFTYTETKSVVTYILFEVVNHKLQNFKEIRNNLINNNLS